MFTITSSAFAAGTAIPERHTCDGVQQSPPLSWRDAPNGTESFALIVDDPDAPDPAAPTRTFVHWVLYNIPADVSGVSDGASPHRLPDDALEGMNDADARGYTGPCPPIGVHRYFHKLYALDTSLADLGSNATKADLERAMEGHVLGTAELIGTYEKDERVKDDA
ncbi:MAG TPA: YbhB/YbcL family Raf kinase inhibitor-like protein [Gemmatimonas sp.]|nr:YbhB/YbcL family Raf kinase inhibitor-like protein [Gemmatimonas sp.]